LRRIDKNPIQASKNRFSSLVTPGIQAVKQWKFHYAQAIKSIVEEGAEGVVQVPCAFVGSASDEVEVTSEDPWARNLWLKFKQILQEVFGITVISGGIDICHREALIRGSSRESSREGVVSADKGVKGEKVCVPGRQYAAV